MGDLNIAGLKGDLARINQIPFDALEAKANVWGTGFTPEGIDQNPVYYEFMLARNWASTPLRGVVDLCVPHAMSMVRHSPVDNTNVW